jgi:hypothetical protein
VKCSPEKNSAISKATMIFSHKTVRTAKFGPRSANWRLMQIMNDTSYQGDVDVPCHAAKRSLDAPALPPAARLDFRHASAHLRHKRPGFYLIMLRNEIRHRSLRDKPVLTD